MKEPREPETGAKTGETRARGKGDRRPQRQRTSPDGGGEDEREAKRRERASPFPRDEEREAPPFAGRLTPKRRQAHSCHQAQPGG